MTQKYSPAASCSHLVFGECDLHALASVWIAVADFGLHLPGSGVAAMSSP